MTGSAHDSLLVSEKGGAGHGQLPPRDASFGFAHYFNIATDHMRQIRDGISSGCGGLSSMTHLSAAAHHSQATHKPEATSRHLQLDDELSTERCAATKAWLCMCCAFDLQTHHATPWSLSDKAHLAKGIFFPYLAQSQTIFHFYLGEGAMSSKCKYEYHHSKYVTWLIPYIM
eukprot:1747228-Amphidinium_carterae.1